jgi:hypothetical protein
LASLRAIHFLIRGLHNHLLEYVNLGVEFARHSCYNRADLHKWVGGNLPPFFYRQARRTAAVVARC